jgi:hypothetical protein
MLIALCDTPFLYIAKIFGKKSGILLERDSDDESEGTQGASL